jgi:DNA-binding beta-propeller fold protein YncE
VRGGSAHPVLAFPRVLAVSPDGGRLYQTIRWLNGALVIDLAKGKVVDRVALGEPVFAPEGKDAHGVAASRDGRLLWLTTQTAGTATVVEAAEGHAVVAQIPVGTDPDWVSLTPDERIAVGSNTPLTTVPVGSAPKRLAVGVVRVGDTR